MSLGESTYEAKLVVTKDGIPFDTLSAKLPYSARHGVELTKNEILADIAEALMFAAKGMRENANEA